MMFKTSVASLALVVCVTMAAPAWDGLHAQSNDAYLNPAARDLVNGARARRQTVDRSILEYRTRSTERISAGYRIIGRDRLLFRRETAADVHWSRTGPIEIKVIGAREVVPVAVPNVQVPTDLKGFVPHIAFDPMDSEFLLRLDTTSVTHPLGSAGEQNYRFRAGDSTVIRLQNGRSVRLRELEFIPRRRDPSLIAGSFWLDADSYAVVQAVFRLSRAFDSTRDSDDDDKPPGWLPSMSADLSYVAVDYGLYELRWWLPRYMVAEGVVKVGNFGAVPMKYERTYSDYEVTGDPGVARVTPDTATIRTCRPGMNLNISVNTSGDRRRDSTVVSDSARARRQAARARRDSIQAADSIKNKRTPCTPREYVITQADDSVLLKSEHLPSSIYAGEALLSEGEVSEITARIRDLPNVPWQIGRPQLAFGLGGPGLLRYNRVEGLSVGARGSLDFGRVAALGELRFGTADRAISAELALQRETSARTYRAGGFRRLASVDPLTRPFSLNASLGSLLLGNDGNLFYRATGAEMLVSPLSSRPQTYSLRVYGERQNDVDRNTNFSVRNLLDDSYVFRRNIQADEATQFGGDLTLRRDFGFNPASLRGGLEVRTRAETGDFEFVQPAATIRMTMPFPFGLAFGGEASAGTSTGVVPTQSLWYIGGTSSLRGYDIGQLRGDSYWRGRAEIATNLPLARLALFSDVAWAGDRSDWSNGRPLLSAGVGASLLDGILRLDVARALREPKGWRLHMYMGGIL